MPRHESLLTMIDHEPVARPVILNRPLPSVIAVRVTNLLSLRYAMTSISLLLLPSSRDTRPETQAPLLRVKLMVAPWLAAGPLTSLGLEVCSAWISAQWSRYI